MTLVDSHKPWPRNLLILLASAVILSLGQELWFGFAPEFLRVLGANVIALGLFGSLQDFFKAAYHYPGGWLNDRFGVQVALVLANLAAGLGYFIYLIAPNFLLVFLGLPFVMAWPAFVLPATLKLLGDALTAQDRPAGFALEAVITRLPTLLAPALGGILIGLLGSAVLGVRAGLLVTLLAAFGTLLLQGVGYTAANSQPQSIGPWTLWSQTPSALKRLLMCEVLVRYAEALPRMLIVLYALESLKAPAWGFGLMLGIEALVAILINGPLRPLLATLGQKPVLLASFVLTALFPITVFYAPGWGWLFGSFVIAGLQAAGEGARKALISDHLQPERRGQHAGLYESLLSLALLPAGLMGGGLWFFVGAWSAFWLALLLGLAGCALYALAGPGSFPWDRG